MRRLAAVLFALAVSQPLAWAQQPAESPTVRMVSGQVVAGDPARRLPAARSDP